MNISFSDLIERMIKVKKILCSDKTEYKYLVACFIKTKEGVLFEIEDAYVTLRCYSENDDWSDAQLVRQGIWNKNDCGLLWIESPRQNILLARVNPYEVVNIESGYITELGEIIILANRSKK